MADGEPTRRPQYGAGVSLATLLVMALLALGCGVVLLRSLEAKGWKFESADGILVISMAVLLLYPFAGEIALLAFLLRAARDAREATQELDAEIERSIRERGAAASETRALRDRLEQQEAALSQQQKAADQERESLASQRQNLEQERDSLRAELNNQRSVGTALEARVKELSTRTEETSETVQSIPAVQSSQAQQLGSKLRSAAERGDTHAVAQLLDQGADVDATDTVGRTALYLATSAGHDRTVELLIDGEADVNARDVNHVSPLSQARGHNHTDIAALLRQHGAEE